MVVRCALRLRFVVGYEVKETSMVPNAVYRRNERELFLVSWQTNYLTGNEMLRYYYIEWLDIWNILRIKD